ncbi:MAG: DUF4349 domain-containing protein [Gemmatimonadota bacterium]
MRSTSVLLCIAALATACRGKALPEEKLARDEVSQSVTLGRSDGPALAAKSAATSELRKAESPAPSDANAVAMPSAHSISDSTVSSMIIRTGQASVEVDSVESGIRAVRALAARVGGYIANSSISEGTDQMHSATLEIKIPASRFDDAINGLQPIGHLESVSVSAEDVGEEFVDVVARAQNGRKLEQRLIDILGTRTGKLGDVLSVERELARVREDIERQEGRMRYLRTRAALSTLAVTVHEKAPVVAGTGSGGMLAEAFRQAWRNFIAFTASAIAALGTLLPLGAIVATVAWLVWRVRRARRPAGDVG